MNPVNPQLDSTQGSTGAVEFQKRLQMLTNKIHASRNVDEIMLELSGDICDLFQSDRLSIYLVSEDKTAIISRVKTGLNAFKDLRLPLAEQSIAGYAGLAKKILNIADVYDEQELKKHHASLRFLREVDKKTGYRTKQMLVAPVLDGANSDLIGVVQLINSRNGLPFEVSAQESIQQFCSTLAIAFRQRLKPVLQRTKYDFLISEGVVSSADFEQATRTARQRGIDLESVLRIDFNVGTQAIGEAISKNFEVPYKEFTGSRSKPVELLKNIKRDYAEQNQWLPIEANKDSVQVVCLDPERIRGARLVSNFFPKLRPEFFVTTVDDFRRFLDSFYGDSVGGGADISEMLSEMSDAELQGAEEDDFGEQSSAAADNDLVKLVNKIIIDAHTQGASDIHIEPYPGRAKTEVRFRKDGTLVPYIEIPAIYRDAMVARLKIMCDLDISEKRKPQDGKIRFKKYGPLDIELRVATIPSAGGVEDVVMRILAAGEPIPIDKLGVSKANMPRLKSAISKPYGLFFVCGPTGSGKTTTLHSILGFLNTSDTKIWTAEDPVEITQKGLRQVQVNKKAGLDFATVMKSFLRADPDIIMVGEMRDKETTGIGIEASLTGHLVFATLHTNSAPESITRLLDMGMDPFNFADALLGILAQRLAKRLCSDCKQAYAPGIDEIRALVQEYCAELLHTSEFKLDRKASYERTYQGLVANFAGAEGKFTLFKPVGCNACGGTGYKGRVGLHELLIASDNIKRLIQEHARVAEILAVCLDEGMRTLKMDGIEKVLQGVTDMVQVRAVSIK
jgi:type II secretory ATPase GspE/PulE/Tfp pilus assembly ATPase PilB-like protein